MEMHFKAARIQDTLSELSIILMTKPLGQALESQRQVDGPHLTSTVPWEIHLAVSSSSLQLLLPEVLENFIKSKMPWEENIGVSGSKEVQKKTGDQGGAAPSRAKRGRGSKAEARVCVLGNARTPKTTNRIRSTPCQQTHEAAFKDVRRRGSLN